MNAAQALQELESMGTAQNCKVYARHGVSGEMFGVSYANLGKLKKKIKVDQALAEELWASGIHDARVLAAMVADPSQMPAARLKEWVQDVGNYVLADALSVLAADSPDALQLMKEWTALEDEWPAACGWNILARLASSRPDLDYQTLEAFLQEIESRIHSSANRVRYSMNSALIAMGIRDPDLEKKALAAAGRIGKVEVDHGQTGCKTPAAAPYIRKAVQRRKQKATA